MALTRTIVFLHEHYRTLMQHLLRDPHTEQLAFLLATHSIGLASLRLLVRDMVLLGADAFTHQSGAHLTVRNEVSRAVLYRCWSEGLSLIEAHSHPFCHGQVSFSGVDTANETVKFAYVEREIPYIYHATMVIGQNSLDAHMWDRQLRMVVPISEVRVLGAPPLSIIPTSLGRTEFLLPWLQGETRLQTPDVFARQVLAFGQEGQRRLQDCCVGLVGTGGIGSAVVQMLAHLGVGHLVLVDPDVVETSNLNRLIGARPGDAEHRTYKVTVMKRLARRINPAIEVTRIRRSLYHPAALSALKDADVLFGCTDNHGSRLVLNTLAVQYCLPLIDIGAGIVADREGRIVEAGGQVRIVIPGDFCLECIGGIDRERAGQDLLSLQEQAQRQARGYIIGADVPAPAVVSLNTTLASLAVNEFLGMITGCKPVQRLLYYDMLAGSVTAVSAQRRADCVCCGPGGLLAAGDLAPLPVYWPMHLPRRIPSLAAAT